jgi:Trk K+ transport system NAD-binding subunit
MAHAFTVRGIVEDRKKPAEEFRNTKLDINLAMNFSKYAGIDLGYLFNRDEDTDIITAANGGVIETTEINESSGILAGMRIALVNFDLLRFISGIQYYRHKEQLPTEFISFSGNLVIKITHHLAIIGTFKHNNLWLPDEGTFKLDPLGFYYGSSLTVRL